MNGNCETPAPQLCDCCDGITSETPELIFNRPGLSAISYRVGTHGTFKASLLAALSNSALPALAPLRTRDDSDFSIALLDAWATSLDILSFYQERIANEFYLRTAVDGRSVYALAQLVGYQPSPGVAASAYLAFTLNSAPGAPDNVAIPAGTRVQSVPGPGQLPQVFETSADLTGIIARNAIPAQVTLPWGLNNDDLSLWIAGTANHINIGDGILFVNQSLACAATAGTTPASPAADFHFVTAVSLDATSGNTLVTWDKPLQWPSSNDDTASVYIFRKTAALFGAQAPDPRVFSTTGNHLASLPEWPKTPAADWTYTTGYSSGQVNLDAAYAGLAPQTGSASWAVLAATPQGAKPAYTAVYQITGAADTGPMRFTLTGKSTQLTLANGYVLPESATSAAFPISDDVLKSIVDLTRTAAVFVQSAQLTPAAPPAVAWGYDGTYARQTGLLQPVEGAALNLVTGEQLSAGQPVAVNGKRLRLQVSTTAQPLSASAGFVPDGSNASQPVTAGQPFLVDAFPPASISSSSDELWSVLTPDGIPGLLTLNPANVLLIPADKADSVVGETVVLSTVQAKGPVLSLAFGPQALTRLYDRSTVTVNANVVPATQGETMHEILGSGDATNPALSFKLKQFPLTFTSSSSGMGAQSTLQVWVNNLRWQQVDNFQNSGPNDRVFTTQTDASGNTFVQFGDGIEGSRTPTGPLNIRAVYRKGLGSAGNVASGQLSQALDRPQGLKGVSNPDAATGGADPDTPADARTSAPLHVLTLDRVVSLEDYQNYARAFAGIAKALATWTWFRNQSGPCNAGTQGVFLTVAGAEGLLYPADDPTLANLKTALWAAGNPHVPISIASYQPVLFEVAGNVKIDQPTYDPGLVLAQIWQTLMASFSFTQRQLGQGIAQSEVIALIQQTPGVIAVQLTALNRKGEPGVLHDVLLVASPVAGESGALQGAEMLLLDPASQPGLGVWS